MATKTPNLQLILPANGEYFNIWDQPLNTNLSIIDTVLGGVNSEVIAARGSTTSLNARLSAGLDAFGNPLPSAEVTTARGSTVYGVPGTLNQRLEAGDREVFSGRQSLASLAAVLAWDADQNKNNSVVSAATNFLTFTGPTVSANGNVSPLVTNINGFRQVVSTVKTTTISGGAGTYYLTLTIVPGGFQYLTNVSLNGVIGTYLGNNLVAKFTDGATNFVTSGVKPGDIITITGPLGNQNLGSYVVLATNTQDNTNLTVNDLAIVGQFASASSGLNYNLNDPISPQFGFTPTAHAKTFTRVTNKIFVGRCVFDGTNVTGLTIYAPLGTYSGFTSISLSGGDFNVTIPHNIGYFPSKISIFGSQVSDFSAPMDLMSVADLSGGGSLQRSVIAQTDDLNLSVKNPTNGLFYKDFSGTSQTSGFLYVVVER